jgi:hypothetical protein
MRTLGPTFLIAAAAAIGVAGCSRSKQPMDDELARDLAVVRAAPTPQFEISPTEAGLSPAPKAPARTAQPTRRPAKQAVAPRTPPRTPAPAPAPRAVVVEAPSAPAPREVIDAPPAPRPARPSAPAAEARRGPYKTEAEIFRQMPWIRP